MPIRAKAQFHRSEPPNPQVLNPSMPLKKPCGTLQTTPQKVQNPLEFLKTGGVLWRHQGLLLRHGRSARAGAQAPLLGGGVKLLEQGILGISMRGSGLVGYRGESLGFRGSEV